MTLYEKIYRLVKKIPYGQVTSYGKIARVTQCSARQVGYAMAATPKDQGIPWHRVVNSKGQISKRKGEEHNNKQRQLLAEEDVVFMENQSINMERFSWDEFEMEFFAEGP